jgi:hypothetical protein
MVCGRTEESHIAIENSKLLKWQGPVQGTCIILHCAIILSELHVYAYLHSVCNSHNLCNLYDTLNTNLKLRSNSSDK